MIVIRYNRNLEVKDLKEIDPITNPVAAFHVVHCDTITLQGAVFSVESKRYDADNDLLIIYVK